MKKFVVFLFFVVLSMGAYAQSSQADKVMGVWLSEEKDGKIQIYKKGNKYFGKIIYSRDNPNGVDSKNPNKKFHKRKVVGLEILTNLKYDGDLVWEDGKIYDPKSGKTYSCKMTLAKNNKTLDIRGYIGFSLIGRTTTWTRTK